jgi:hypothetical protein
VHHFGQRIVGVYLHRESVLHIEQLHQHATRLLVGITEPGLADWTTRRRIGGECAKAISAPNSRDEARGYYPG